MEELIFTFLATRPEFSDPTQCSRELVGPMREYLSKFGSPAILDGVVDPPPRLVELIALRAAAATDTTDFCIRCGRCDWARKPAWVML